MDWFKYDVQYYLKCKKTCVSEYYVHCKNFPALSFFLPAQVVRNTIIASVPTRNPDAILLPSGGCHCTTFYQLVTSLKTAMFLVDMSRVSIYRVGSFLGTNKMVQ